MSSRYCIKILQKSRLLGSKKYLLKNDKLCFNSKEKDYRINLNFTEISIHFRLNHFGDENQSHPRIQHS